MLNPNPPRDKIHRANCGNAIAMNDAGIGCTENVAENSANHETLYKVATVAAALLLLAGAAAA